MKYTTYDMQVDLEQPPQLDPIEYEGFVLEFEIVFVEKAFSQWELSWFYSLCALTLCFM